MHIRPLTAADLPAGEAMVREAIGGSPYEARLAEVVQNAGTGSDDVRALVAERDGVVVGMVVYGEFAGARGAGRLYGVIVAVSARGEGIGTALVEQMVAELREQGVRFIIAEVPDDLAVLGDYRAFLMECSFREEARVIDYYRDDIALVFLRRDLEE